MDDEGNACIFTLIGKHVAETLRFVKSLLLPSVIFGSRFLYKNGHKALNAQTCLLK